MKAALFYTLLATACYGSTVAKILPYKERFVTSRIDHFSAFITKPDTFQQRLLVATDFFDPTSGPILVYTGNEGPIDQFWNNTGFVFELAEAFRGYVIFIEHRFYGKSLPFGTEWHQNYNYQYLTVEQALADFAVILTDLKAELGHEERKVIAFGGSYGGVLTAAMRLKYPNIIDGGLAASAPISPMGGYDFYRAVTEDCEKYNPKCPTTVRDGYTEALTLATQGPSGLEKVASMFKLCKPLTADNMQHFLLWARNAWTTMAMADYPYPASFLGNLPAYPINDACDTVLSGATAMAGLANATVRFYDATMGQSKCHDPAVEYIDCADSTGCGLMSQWDIQVCLQVRLPSGTNNKTDMFPPMEAWTPTMYESYCQQMYGPQLAYSASSSFYNINFWGDKFDLASNLIFSNGNLDPWRYGGVPTNVFSISRSVFSIIVEGGAHHLDLRSSNPKDPATVTAARDLEKQIISLWIAE